MTQSLEEIVQKRTAELDKDNVKAEDPHCDIFNATTKCMLATTQSEIEEARNQLWQAIKDREKETIEQVYHARTEEVVKIAEGMKKAVLVEDLKMGDIDELEKENYNQALTDLIATLTKVSNTQS